MEKGVSPAKLLAMLQVGYCAIPSKFPVFHNRQLKDFWKLTKTHTEFKIRNSSTDEGMLEALSKAGGRNEVISFHATQSKLASKGNKPTTFLTTQPAKLLNCKLLARVHAVGMSPCYRHNRPRHNRPSDRICD